MKWEEFGQLPPEERRRRRWKPNRTAKELSRLLDRMRKEGIEVDAPIDLDSLLGPFQSIAPIAMIGYAEARTSEALIKWLNTPIPHPKDPTRVGLAPNVLLIAARDRPQLYFGFWTKDAKPSRRKFVPGILTQLMARSGYAHELERMLMHDDLSGLSVADVVARCRANNYSTNAEAVRKAVQTWDVRDDRT